MGECLESLVMDTPDDVVSGMEVAGGSPPADIDISGGPDVLPTAISVMTVVSEKWMKIVINQSFRRLTCCTVLSCSSAYNPSLSDSSESE